MILKNSQYKQMIEQARRDAPYETCGMIGGKDGHALKMYPIKNVAEDRVKRYLMDGSEQLAAMQDMDNNGFDIMVIYHSHPISPAYPSPTDMRDAYDSELNELRYPGTLYIIMTLMSPEAPEMHAYDLADGLIKQVPIRIEDRHG